MSLDGVESYILIQSSVEHVEGYKPKLFAYIRRNRKPRRQVCNQSTNTKAGWTIISYSCQWLIGQLGAIPTYLQVGMLHVCSTIRPKPKPLATQQRLPGDAGRVFTCPKCYACYATRFWNLGTCCSPPATGIERMQPAPSAVSQFRGSRGASATKSFLRIAGPVFLTSLEQAQWNFVR